MGVRKYSIEDVYKFADQHKGKCLSTEYKGYSSELLWQCKQGHIWKDSFRSIRRRTWCPDCSGYKHYIIEDMRELARKRGGICLSEKYINAKTKLQWQCENKHIWDAQPSSILRNRWCPYCRTHTSERICCGYFEYIFNAKFSKKHPKWLRSDIGGQLELDGYNEQLKLAFEYQGIQHYQSTRQFTDENKFKTLQKRDHIKSQLCKEHHIILIQISYMIKYEDMQEFIIKEYYRQGGNRLDIHHKPKDYREFEEIFNITSIKDMQALAAQHNGKCLSKQYIYAHVKLQWQCEQGHIWETKPYTIKQGCWCPVCGRKKRGITRRKNLEKRKV